MTYKTKLNIHLLQKGSNYVKSLSSGVSDTFIFGCGSPFQSCITHQQGIRSHDKDFQVFAIQLELHSISHLFFTILIG